MTELVQSFELVEQARCNSGLHAWPERRSHHITKPSEIAMSGRAL
jgi:hypothetical protein